jgi:hypothetical protein
MINDSPSGMRPTPANVAPLSVPSINENMSEEEKINVMFKQQAHQWQNTQDQMAT